MVRRRERWWKKLKLKRLLTLNQKYKYRLKNLSENSKTRLKRYFGLDDNELEGFLLFFNDIFLEDETDKPRFTFPQKFPFGILIDNYDIDNEKRQINLTDGIKIRPMFFTLGGNMAEQITGSILRR